MGPYGVSPAAASLCTAMSSAVSATTTPTGRGNIICGEIIINGT